MKESLLFPYLRGLLFVRAAKATGGWDEVSGLYRELPTSTEQVLWPERYFESRDEPTLLNLPDSRYLLDTGWRRVDENVLGELGFRTALRESGSESDAVDAAHGWDGDRYALYERGPGETTLVSVSIWDSEGDAAEFERAWQGRREVDSGGGGDAVTIREGARVAIVLDLPQPLAERVARAALESLPSTANP